MKKTGIHFAMHHLRDVAKNFHSEIELLFLIKGKAELTIGSEAYVMTENSVVLVNCEKQHSLRVLEPGTMCQIMIDYQTISEYLDSDYFLFWCNSVSDTQGQYERLIKLIQTIIATKYSRNNAEDFGILGLYYQLLDMLTRRYLLDHNDIRYKENNDESNERVHEIIRYVQRNYKQDISLNELADKLYLSNAYLSRFFKKTFGQNFKDYVNSIRMIHAIDDLLTSDKNMTKVAMDNGFPSISRFNQVFKETYGMSPLTYRDTHLNDNNASDAVSDEQSEEVWNEVKEYVQSQHIESIDAENQINNVYIDTGNYRYIDKNWAQAMNAGPLSDIVKGQVQRDILRLHDSLDITYIRFWNIFDMVDFGSGAQFNFNYLDRSIEFLLQNHMKPYLVLGGKERDIMRNFEEKIFMENLDDSQLLVNPDLWKELMNSFCHHLMVYFGSEEVSTWVFELRRPKEWDSFYTGETNQLFEVWFDTAKTILKNYFPNVKVGGCEIVVGWWDDPEYELEDTLKYFERIQYVPDFLSITVFPYEKTKPTMNADYLRDVIITTKKVLSRYGLDTVPIVVSEWCNTVSNRNIYNESTYKGAYLIQNLTMNMELADKIVYWNASDVFGEFYDTQDVLYGGVGLFNKNGIAKPAFYAFEFLKELYKYQIQCTRNYILTTDGHGNYRILCNNMKALNYQYCSVNDSEIYIEPWDYEKYFVDLDALNFRFHLTGVQDGTYLIRRQMVSKEHGSILDELNRWEYQTDIKHKDMKYLRDMCKPKLTLGNAVTEKGVLEIISELPANAFELIEISIKYHND